MEKENNIVQVEISLYYHLRQKAGVNSINITVPAGTTIKEIINKIEDKYPILITHLDNVMILMGKQIAIVEDKIIKDTKLAFLTPIGGG